MKISAEPASNYAFGLIGWPVEHSLSPRLHQAALAAAGLAGDYALFPVENGLNRDKQLSDLLQKVRNGELSGLNVTIPHKQHVIPLLDELSPQARQIGAVNTIVNRSDRLVGENTDATGFLRDLKLQFPALQSSSKKALVFGAGGSARAIVSALAGDGWQVQIYSRRAEKTEGLVQQFPSVPVQAVRNSSDIQWEKLNLAVNCTPLGMNPNPDASPWPEGIAYPPHISVYDLVYAPRETRLVWEAKASSVQACNGLGMLVEQAALAFELWTGIKADRAAMKAALQ